MINNYPIKKGKGIYIYDIQSKKYYDFSHNTNIIGYSNKKLTTIVKNHISSRWNIKYDTVIHRRFKKLINELFDKTYKLKVVFSLNEILLRIISYLKTSEYSINIVGEGFRDYFGKNIINPDKTKNNNKKINIIDMVEYYISDESDISEYVNNKKNISCLNYYWYPEINIKPYTADLIILPELFSGNFSYLNILLNKKSEFFNELNDSLNDIEEIPSLYIASSLKMYYLILKEQKNYIQLNWKDFIQKKRLFTYDLDDIKNYKKLVDLYYKRNIILNDKPPYYNYLPLFLEDFQIKYIKGLKI